VYIPVSFTGRPTVKLCKFMLCKSDVLALCIVVFSLNFAMLYFELLLHGCNCACCYITVPLKRFVLLDRL
jgi:hypothetical protein